MQVTCRDPHAKVREEVHVRALTMPGGGSKCMQTHRLIRVNIPSIGRCRNAKCSKHESTCLFYRSGGEERCRDRNGCSDQKALVSAEGQAQIQEGPPQTFKFIRRARATPVRN